VAEDIEADATVQYNLFCSQLLPDRRGGRPESSLSLRSHGGGTPLPLGPGEGGVTTPYSWSIAGSTVGSLLRGTGGFKPSEREPQPHPSHGRSSSQALFPPPPSPVVSVAWISERGDDVVRVHRRLQISHSAAMPTRGSIGYAQRVWLR
jgi:hypothetical protein